MGGLSDLDVRPGGQLGGVAALAVGYFVTARLGTELASISVVSAIWPAAGVALAGLILFGLRAWPGIAVAGCAEIMSHGVPLTSALAVAAGQTISPVVAVMGLRAVGFDPRLRRMRDVIALVVIGGLVSNVVTALVGPAALLAAGRLEAHEWPVGTLAWWVGDVIGVLAVAPLLLLVPRSARAGRPGSGRTAETVGVLAATTLACTVLFRTSLPLVFLIFPFPLWAALRLGVWGAGAANLVVAGAAVWTTIQGQGPFAGLPSTVRLASLQSFNASVAITSLLLAALMDERMRALDELRESRARLVRTADTERRRLERDLHDGAQQRLLALSLSLGLARAQADPGELDGDLDRTLAIAGEELRSAQAELRALARGIHPVILTQHGLGGALESLAEQAVVPVEIRAEACRYPPVVEATAYFIVCEALTNMAEHARATSATVDVHHRGAVLIVDVSDDGVGGADPTRGSGLTGLSDRAAALGGTVTVHSEPGQGTRLRAELPCGT